MLNLNARSLIFITICIITNVFLSVTLLDIFIIKQIIGFIFLSFIPGYLIFSIFVKNHPNNVEKLLYSMGLSISYLIAVGLIVDISGHWLGLVDPLNTISLSLTISSSVIFLAFVNFWRSRNHEFSFITSYSISLSRLFGLSALPILAVIGGLSVNFYGCNIVLLLVICAIAVVFSLGILSEKALPKNYYWIALLSISLSLLFSTTLVSNYIQGADVQLEYYVTELTKSQSYWNPSFSFGNYYSVLDTARYHSMLSITILPTEYSNLIGLDTTWVFKIVFPLLFAFVPLCVYALVRNQLNEKVAFISSFVVMAEQNFMLITGLAREMIGEIFFLLLLLILLQKTVKGTAKNAFLVLFSFALVASHYTMGIIFLFLLSALFFYNLINKKTRKIVSIKLLLAYLLIIISWFNISSNSASFESLGMGVKNLLVDLSDFFVPSSRGDGVLSGIGLQTAGVTQLQMISRVFAYSIQLFIIIGVLVIIFSKKINADGSYKSLIFAGAFLLSLTIILPGFALSLQVSRFYHISLLFLAPAFVVGCTALIHFFMRKESKQRFYAVALIILMILTPYFLFQTNFLYEITNHESWSVPLSEYRMGIRPYTEFNYVNAPDVLGSRWLNSNFDSSSTVLYADSASVYNVLTSYGMVPRDIDQNTRILWNKTNYEPLALVFLSKINLESGYFAFGNSHFNSSQIMPVLGSYDILYNNGQTIIGYKAENIS